MPSCATRLKIAVAFTLIATAADAVTTFPLPSGHNWAYRGGGIAAGPDGNLWFSGASADSSNLSEIGRITTSGVVTMFPLPGGHMVSEGCGIAAGPDGNLWFSGARIDSTNELEIGRITTSGVVTMFPLTSDYGLSEGCGIAAGPDGNLWFSGAHSFLTNESGIGQITTSGVVTMFPLPSGHSWSGGSGIAAGPDGNLWFSGARIFPANESEVGRITTGGVVTMFPLSSGYSWSQGSGIVAGPDGNMWFSGIHPFLVDEALMGRITTGGVVTLFSLPSGHVWEQYTAVASGPDGSIWFTGAFDRSGGYSVDEIGRITPAGDVRMFSLSRSHDWLNYGGIAAGLDGHLWFTSIGTNEANVSKVGRSTCEAEPATGCISGTRASFQIGNTSRGGKIRWKLSGGDAFDQLALGDPTTTSAYEFCIYDETGNTASLAGGLYIHPGSSWDSKDPNGFTYRDPAGAENGVAKVKLKTGLAGSTGASLGASGAHLPVPVPLSAAEFLDQDSKVVVQLTNTETATCWTSEFTTNSRNIGSLFKAKTP